MAMGLEEAGVLGKRRFSVERLTLGVQQAAALPGTCIRTVSYGTVRSCRRLVSQLRRREDAVPQIALGVGAPMQTIDGVGRQRPGNNCR